MYKYTYLLSDCYRHDGAQPALPQSIHQKKQSLSLHQQPRQPSAPFSEGQRYKKEKSSFVQSKQTMSRLEQLKIQYNDVKKVSFEPEPIQPSKHHNLQVHHHETEPHFYPQAQTVPLQTYHQSTMNQAPQVPTGQKRDQSLEIRLKKLVNLGERTEEALRQVSMQSKLKEISDKYASKKQQVQEGFNRHGFSKEDKQNCNPSSRSRSKTSHFDQAYQYSKRSNVVGKQTSFSRIPDLSSSVGKISAKPLNDSGMKGMYEAQKIKNTRIHSKFQPQNDVTRKDVKELIEKHISKAKRDGQDAVNEYKNRQTRETLKFDTFNPNKRNQGPAIEKLSSLQEKINASLRSYKDI